MTNPYFSVGEQVLLVSKYNPEYNGDYTVIDIISRSERNMKAEKSGFVFSSDSDCPYSYDLGFSRPLRNDCGEWRYFGQAALRKKHRPADESFSELMTNYNSVITEEESKNV